MWILANSVIVRPFVDKVNLSSARRFFEFLGSSFFMLM